MYLSILSESFIGEKSKHESLLHIPLNSSTEQDCSELDIEDYNQNTSFNINIIYPNPFNPVTNIEFSTHKAEKLIDAVVRARQKLQNKKLRTEKYNLIKEIKKNYKVEDFFRARIPNYKVFASIYKTFVVETTNVFDPTEEVESNFSIIEHITRNKTKPKNTESQVISEFKGEDKDLRLLSYQLMVDNFNGKYKKLNSMQRNLLKEYINNISNTNSLREFINSEVKKVKEILTKILPRVNDDITKIKLTEAIKQVDGIKKGKIVKDKQVVSLMRYYELIKELHNVTA